MKTIVKSAACALLILCLACAFGIKLFASEPDVSAKAAVVYCVENQILLYSKNAELCLPMASTTKIMSTVLTLESGDLDSKFTVDTDATKTEGSSMGLVEGDVVTKRALCYGMMLPSGNDAANAAAVAVSGSVDDFVDLMNKKAAEIGMLNTHFVTPSGLDDYTDEHYSTAYDMALLTAYALDNSDFSDICSTVSKTVNLGSDDRNVRLSNSNRLLTMLDDCVGVKTGFTDKAGRCLVSAVRSDGVTLICVTLNAPNDWNDHIKLYNHCIGKAVSLELDEVSLRVPLVGAPDNVALLESESQSVVLMASDVDKIQRKILVPRFVYASFDRNAPVGKVVYYLDCTQIASANLFWHGT